MNKNGEANNPEQNPIGAILLLLLYLLSSNTKIDCYSQSQNCDIVSTCI